MARSVRLGSGGIYHGKECPAVEGQAVRATKRNTPRLRENHYPEISEERPLSEEMAVVQRRRRYIPPRNHPWRRFRLPGSPPDNKVRDGWWV